MRQALHIFRKDVRCLRLEISMALAAVAGLTFSVARAAAPLADRTISGVPAGLLMYLVPLTWWALTVRVVHSEPPAGDQPFWVTRPYSRKSLLAAKALFIVVFVNLPKLAGDIAVLHAYGFRIRPELGGLLWTQVLLTALILPVAALSAVTTDFLQLIVTTFLLGLAVAAWNLLIPDSLTGGDWLTLEWTRSYSVGLVVAVAALVIVLRQYVRRSTVSSRFLAGGAVALAFLMLAFLPWPAAFALQSRVSNKPIDVSAVRAGFDADMNWRVRAVVQRDKSAYVQVPLRVTGIPAGLQVRGEGIAARIESGGAEVWRGDGQPLAHMMRWTGDSAVFHATIGPSVYEKIRSRPLRIRGSVYFTLYGNPRGSVLPIRDQAVFMPTPGSGLCSAVQTGGRILLICRTAFKSRPDLVSFHVMGIPFIRGRLSMVFRTLSSYQRGSYSPFPADAGLVPVAQSVQIADTYDPRPHRVLEIRAVALEPVAHVRTEFDVSGLRLEEYVPDR